MSWVREFAVPGVGRGAVAGYAARASTIQAGHAGPRPISLEAAVTLSTDPLPALATYVMPHLSFAATAVEACWIEVGPEKMPGRFGYPDEESGTLPVWFDRNAEALPYIPEPGTHIRVSYEVQGEAYAWKSVVKDTDGATSVRCVLPTKVERQDRRASPRIRVLGRPGLRLEVRMTGDHEYPVQLVDISTGGVAILTAEGAVRNGDRLLARLEIPGGEVIRVVLEVVGVRTGPAGQALAGCLFASITEVSRQQIAELVYAELRSDK